MYHPSRGGVRGGHDQFNWDDVKIDKYRENYLGHSVKAPVGRWQKGKDLTWYAKDKTKASVIDDALKAEIQKIKEEEEQSMREILGLAPRREKRPHGSRLDKRETTELFKRGKHAEEFGATYAEGERVQGLGFAPAPRHVSSKDTLLLQTRLSDSVQEDSMDTSAIMRSGQSSNKEANLCSDGLDSKSRKKMEKREAKEKRKVEKRAAKKAAKMEKRKYDRDSLRLGMQKVRRRHDSSEN